MFTHESPKIIRNTGKYLTDAQTGHFDFQPPPPPPPYHPCRIKHFTLSADYRAYNYLDIFEIPIFYLPPSNPNNFPNPPTRCLFHFTPSLKIMTLPRIFNF